MTGRDEEIRQIVDILMRRRQNNPILTGEAGVGKTAVVEGFAQRLARGDVPPQLKDVSLLHARHRPAAGRRQHEGRVREPAAPGDRRGAGVARSRSSCSSTRSHTLVGAGGAAGTGDAANLLKPALARGNAAHDRRDDLGRVQEVHREGPGADAALPGRAGAGAERGEGDPDAARRGRDAREAPPRAAARRGDRGGGASCRIATFPARQLPDKAVSLLDTACARVAVSQHATPAEVEDCQRRIEALRDRERDHRPRGGDRHRRRRRAGRRRREARARATSALVELEQRWQEEKGIVDRMLDIARASCAAASKPVDRAGSRRAGGSSRQRPRRRRRRRRERRRRRADRASAARRAARAAGQARDAAGRVAADPAVASTRRRSPASSPTGPASRSAAW